MSIESRPTWEEKDGDVVPSYTGVNAPQYPNHPNHRKAEDLHRTHHEVTDLDPTAEAIAAARRIVNPDGTPPAVLPDNYDGATAEFINNRENILGDS